MNEMKISWGGVENKGGFGFGFSEGDEGAMGGKEKEERRC